MRHSARKHCLSAVPRICFLSVFCLTCAAYVNALVSKRNRCEELQIGNAQRDEGREINERIKREEVRSRGEKMRREDLRTVYGGQRTLEMERER